MAHDALNLSSASVSSVSVTDLGGRQAAQVPAGISDDASKLASADGMKSQYPSSSGAEVSKREQQHSAQELEKQAQELQEMSQLKGWAVSFRVDNDLDKTIITVVDEKTQETIRQIPSEELLTISRRVQALRGGETGSNTLAGLLLNSKV